MLISLRLAAAGAFVFASAAIAFPRPDEDPTYDGKQAKEWVESRLHELRHGQEEKFLAQMAELKVPRGKNAKTIREQKNYFANQAERMNYDEIAKRGWPIGSGAVESACSGHQNRFKRRGQFWTHEGFGNLAALKQARENKHWDQLWFAE